MSPSRKPIKAENPIHQAATAPWRSDAAFLAIGY